jgi:hypothetical protein
MTPFYSSLANHLWQSTLFAVAAGLLDRAPENSRRDPPLGVADGVDQIPGSICFAGRRRQPVAKNGPKLQAAAARDCSERFDCHNLHGGPAGGLTGKTVSMQDLAESLTMFSDRWVMDATGVRGDFDIELPFWSNLIGPETPGVASGREPAPDPAAPDLFAVLQQQLGLKLESRKGPVETYVVEHAEKPSDN